MAIFGERHIWPFAVSFDPKHRDIHARYRISRTSSLAPAPLQMVAAVLGASLRRRPTFVIAMHVKLAALAMVAAWIGRCDYAVTAYGHEVWCDLPWLSRLGIRRASAVWSISEFTDKQVSSRVGVECDRLRRFPMPFTFPVVESATRTRGRLLSVSRLNLEESYKGVDQLISCMPELLSRLPFVSLHIVGDGDALASLQRKVMDLGLDTAVTMLGKLSDDELAAEYQQAEVFALPGRTVEVASGLRGEGFGLVFLEAAAYGTPSIGGLSGGASSAIAHNQTGLLVDGNNLHDIAQALESLLSHEELRTRLGKNAQANVRARNYTHEIRALYTDAGF